MKFIDMNFNKTFLTDSLAGVVVFLVALPLCLGIALASGVPLVSGIWAGIIGGLVVGIFSGSSLSVSGPAAGLVGVVLGALIACGSLQNFYIAVIISGVFQLVFGLVGLGRMAQFFPSSVIHGLLAAVGATIILKQWPVVHRQESWNAFILFTVCVLGYLAWEKLIVKRVHFLQLVPAAMISVFIGIVFVVFDFNLNSSDYVALPVFEDPLQLIQIVSFDTAVFSNIGIWTSALSIAIIGSVETLINLGAADSLDPMKRKSPPNRELLAQGAANITAGFLGGIPITSVVVRSSANIMAGARTRWSAIFHALLLIIALFFAARWINFIPLASLSAILVIVGYKLVKPSVFVDTYKHGKLEFIPFVVTLSITLATDLLKGVAAGIVVFIFMTKALKIKE